MSLAIDQLREQIRHAFPPSAYYSPITDCICDEWTGKGPENTLGRNAAARRVV